MENNLTFCDRMRKATRGVHAVSDSLVNAKLALGLHSDKVWADGLLVFYEIFRFLERAIADAKNSQLHEFRILLELERTKAFEDDLSFYLGKNWMKNYSPRPSVREYLEHLRKLEDCNPLLLMAYIYHLYMGLLSGGQLLRKKRQLMRKISPFKNDHLDGNRVTNFGDTNIYQLKMKIRKTMNDIAVKLDDNTKDSLIEESKIVFAMNNVIIRSVEGVGSAIIKKLIIFIMICMILLIFYNYMTSIKS